MADGHHAEGHYPGMWVFPQASETTQDVAAKTNAMPKPLVYGLVVSGILLVLGIVGFVIRAATSGFDDYAPWGYYAATFSFVFMITSTAPLAAVAFRITKSHWRRPLTRVSELFGLLGIFNVLMFIPLMMVLPPINNPDAGSHELELRRTLWFEVPIGAPHWWDMLGIIGLALAGLVILWVSMTPDLAEARLTATGFRRSVYRLLSGHWHGTKRQWNYQKAWLAMLGAFYFMLLIFMHFTISTDYAMSMIAGWKDSIFPVVYSLTGFQSSLGLILVILFILRRWGGYHTYIGISPFWSASKLVLAFSLLWCYHMFAFGITYWYGRLEVEQNILQYLLFKSYGGMFAANFLLSFVMPFLLLLWNPVRRSDWGPALAGMIVLAGAFVFNLRIFVASFNAGDVYAHFLGDVPPPVYPALWDVFIVLGGLGLVAFFYLLATRLFPLMCVWEIKEGTMYQKMGNFMRGRYLVLAKPE